MENFNILRIIARQWPLILVLTLAAGLGSYWFSGRKPASSFGSLSVTVQSKKVYPDTSQLILQSDNAAGTQLLVATSQGWITDPSYVQEVLSKANVTAGDSSLKGLSKVFQIVSPVVGASTYQVQFTGKSDDEVSRTFTALRGVLDASADQYNKTGTSDLRMNLLYSVPVITSQSSSVPLAPLAGLAVGLVFSLAVAALLEQKGR